MLFGLRVETIRISILLDLSSGLGFKYSLRVLHPHCCQEYIAQEPIKENPQIFEKLREGERVIFTANRSHVYVYVFKYRNSASE